MAHSGLGTLTYELTVRRLPGRIPVAAELEVRAILEWISGETKVTMNENKIRIYAAFKNKLSVYPLAVGIIPQS